MLHAGARGKTADELAEVFHYDLKSDETNAAIRGIFKQGGWGSDSFKMNMASRLWAKTGLEIEPEFIRTIGDLYNAEIDQIDFGNTPDLAAATINEWTAEQTSRAIEKVIEPEEINEDTRLILTNAMYFKATWEEQFLPDQTEEAPFYLSETKQISVPMMNQTSTFPYSETPEVQILEMPYASNTLSMVVMLPTTEGGLGQLEDQLVENYCSLVTTLEPEEVMVRIPKFQFEQTMNLLPIMAKLGLSSPFQPGLADFSGITKQEPIHIENARHIAFIDVTEEGTEAAAVDIFDALWCASDQSFIANRPFLFVIREKTTGVIVFLGRVVNPQPNSLPEERKSSESTDCSNSPFAWDEVRRFE